MSRNGDVQPKKKIMKTNTMVLGIDIGGTDVKFGVLLGDSILYQSKIPSNKESVEGILSEICDECKRISKEFPYEKIGVGVPGVVYD